MKIESVDAFYLRLPEVRDVGDGSQDSLLIRVTAGGYEGWGECEASPLTTIAALIAPMSHSGCHPVFDCVLGKELEGPESIRKVHKDVRMRCMDLLQADHALSGIDIALWDLLGHKESAPVWSFFASSNQPKLAYASQLFGDMPDDTFMAATAVAKTNFRAAKFGWGRFGRGSLNQDRDQVAAARAGLGPDIHLMVDSGGAFDHDVEQAALRIPILEEFDVVWWEEPFMSGALAEYANLSTRTNTKLAGGEGAHNADMARHLIDYADVGFVQIDTGRIGGISAAREVANYAKAKGVQFVNHTFTNNLALSASLQPYADMAGYSEVPVAASELAAAIAGNVWGPDENGHVRAPDAPGLGTCILPESMEHYRQHVEILWRGGPLWPL